MFRVDCRATREESPPATDPCISPGAVAGLMNYVRLADYG